MSRLRRQTEGSDASDHYKSVNERPVDDISLEFFYQPHTITTMVLTIAFLTYTAFVRDESLDWHSNVLVGLGGVVVIFMIISILHSQMDLSYDLTLPSGAVFLVSQCYTFYYSNS